MTTSPQSIIVGDTSLERRATLTLAVATVLVGASIVADGNLARALNGIAGITWFAATAMFIVDARRRGSTLQQWLTILALTAIVAFVVKPSDIVLATIGFTSAGFIAALAGRRHPLLWAKLVPALYLPLHIGTAVLKAAGRSALGMEASIRTDPPPTAVIVPAVMLVAAIVGGIFATMVINRQRARAQDSPQTTTSPHA